MASFDIEAKNLIENPNACAVPLYLLLTKQYGEEWLQWEPSTIYLELRADFATECAAEVVNKFSALQILLTSDNFFVYTDAFIGICNTMCEGSPSFSVFNPAVVAEIAWTTVETALLREFPPVGLGVKQYINIMLAEEGLEDTVPGVVAELLDDTTPAGAVVDELKESIRDRNNLNQVETYVEEQFSMMLAQIGNLGLHNELGELLRKTHEQPAHQIDI